MKKIYLIIPVIIALVLVFFMVRSTPVQEVEEVQDTPTSTSEPIKAPTPSPEVESFVPLKTATPTVKPTTTPTFTSAPYSPQTTLTPTKNTPQPTTHSTPVPTQQPTSQPAPTTDPCGNPTTSTCKYQCSVADFYIEDFLSVLANHKWELQNCVNSGSEDCSIWIEAVNNVQTTIDGYCS